MAKTNSKESSSHELAEEFNKKMAKACETRRVTSEAIERKLAELAKYKDLID